MNCRYVIIDFCDHDFGNALDRALLCYKISPSIMNIARFKRQIINGMLHEQWMWDKSLERLATHDEERLRRWFEERIRISYSDKPPVKDSDNASRYIDRANSTIHSF